MGSPKKESCELPSWGIMKHDDIKKIEKNKYTFLTQRIIQKLLQKFPLNKNQIKAQLYEIQKYNKQLNNKVNYSDKAHYDYFKQEDTSLKTYEDLIRYLNIDYNLGINYDTIIKEMKEYSPVILQVKQTLNRLRPHQASHLLKIPIKHLDSESANTPSMPAGHSAQGMLVAAILYRNNKPFFDTNEKVLNKVMNVCLDVGRRRIIAGLHYPIDHQAAKVLVLEVVEDWDIPLYVKLLNESLP
jgi:hypothetical protein